MEELKKIKRKQSSYRLTVVNEDTFVDMLSVKINRLNVYIFLSTSFVFIVAVTILLISFTPLKYYIPGYGSKNAQTSIELLKIKTDSLENVLNQNDEYLNNIKKILKGDSPFLLDTNSLNITNVETNQD